MSETGAYLYAVSRGVRADQLTDVRGIAGEQVRLVEHGGLGAVVSAVDLDEFGDEGLRRNLEDLAWLEQVARTHDAVVTQVSRLAVTAPLRLATICFDDDGVRGRLEEWQAALTTSLDRIEDRVEWSVKAYDAPAAPAATERSSDTPESGTAYLTRRRTENSRRADASEAAAQVADQIHRRIADLVVASRRLPPQDPRLTGHEGTMTLNGAYLVDESRSKELEVLVAGITEEHPEARIELHGPWPPYSFATLEEP